MCSRTIVISKNLKGQVAGSSCLARRALGVRAVYFRPADFGPYVNLLLNQVFSETNASPDYNLLHIWHDYCVAHVTRHT